MLRFAETLLKGDAFDGWHALRAERETWTYEEFWDAMMGEYCSPGLRTSRETAFFTTGYDSSIPVAEVIQQFKRELLYCRHLRIDETSLIGILSRRLAPEILFHLSTTEFTSLRAFQRAVILYDDQRQRIAASSVP